MSDVVQSLADDQDADLAALFTQSLAPAALPPGALDRVTQLVLGEVQQTLSAPVPAPGPAPALAPAPAPGPAPAAAAVQAQQTIRPAEPLHSRLRAWLRRLSPGQSLLLAGGGALAVMLVFIGISRITPRPLTAEAAVNGGSATVLSHHNSRFRVQSDGDQLRLRQGDRLLTDSGSVQLVHFTDHTTLIEPGADVELTHLGEEGGGQQLALTVRDGLVRSTLAAPLRTNDQYLIYAPGITVTAVGTDFVVEAISEEETLVTALEGQVAVTMGQQTITLGPGQEVDAVIGETLAVYSTGE